MWLSQIFDLDTSALGPAEDAIRAMDGVKMVSALRDGQPYIVVECPTEGDAVRVQNAVALVDPAAIVVTSIEDPNEAQELVGP